KQLRYWSVAGDGKQVRAVTGHGDVIIKVVAHPSKPILATCGADKTVRLWTTDSGAAARTLSGHTDHVFAVALSPDATLVASGSYNGEVKVWKAADGTVVKAFNGSPGYEVAATPEKK